MSPPTATTSSDVLCHPFTPFIILKATTQQSSSGYLFIVVYSPQLFLEMAGRKGKNIMINDEAQPSATKRMRIELLNAEFPSTHLHPRNTTSTDLQLSPPAEIPVEEAHPDDDDDDVFTSLISQQNYLINYHMNEMQRNVEELWRRNLSEQVKRRKEMERRVEEKEEQMVRFREMCYYHEDRAFLLDEKLQQMVAGEGCSAAAPNGVGVEEEVDSCYVERRRNLQLACLNCLSRPATMVWLPCRHLCVCLVCESSVKGCLVCGAEKTQSLMINALP